MESNNERQVRIWKEKMEELKKERRALKDAGQEGSERYEILTDGITTLHIAINR